MNVKTTMKQVGDKGHLRIDVTLPEDKQMILDAYCKVFHGKTWKEVLEDICREGTKKYIEGAMTKLNQIIC